MRTATTFLTVLPVGRRPTGPVGAATLVAFPMVGGLVGAVWAAVGTLAAATWGPFVAAAAVLAVDAAVTGGLHLDGLADVGDVAGSRRRGADALVVARDPNVGALGVVLLTSVVLVRFALLVSLLTGGPAWSLLAVPVVGRAAMVHALARWRGFGGSSASVFAAATSWRVEVVVALLAVAALAAVTAPLRVAAGVGASVVVIAVGTRWWRRRVGLPSGDAVGAIGVLVETAVLAVLAAG